VHVRYVRHDCARQGGKSVSLELREHYAFSPEYWIGRDGQAIAGDAPLDDPAATVIWVPAKRFGWIWTEGRCAQCGMTARSSAGRLVDPADRPPADRAVLAGAGGG
jgi:hypothetical protein